jgi:hypothetical protein
VDAFITPAFSLNGKSRKSREAFEDAVGNREGGED